MRSAAGVAFILFVLSTVAALAPPRAAADQTWCWDDPVVAVSGRLVSISVGVYGEPLAVDAAVDAAQITIIVPTGVSAQLVAESNLYFPEQVSFEARETWTPGQPIPVTVTVRFEATAALPAALKVTYPAGLTTVATDNGSTGNGQLKAIFSL